MNKSANFKVNGMHCGGCANKIKKQINELNIENAVEVNVETGNVNIKFNSNQATLAVLKDSIAKAGFQVETVELE